MALFEGRSWQGWQHHVTLVLLAYGFLVLQRRQRRGKKKYAADAAGSFGRDAEPPVVLGGVLPHL